VYRRLLFEHLWCKLSFDDRQRARRSHRKIDKTGTAPRRRADGPARTVV